MNPITNKLSGARMLALDEAFNLMEDELEKLGWSRRPCSYWIDPVTATRHPTSHAYAIAKQRQEQI